MAADWGIETTSEFAEWLRELGRPAQIDVAAKLALLRDVGPTLGRPHVDTVRGSSFPNMKELRIKRDQIRVFSAFDPRRVGVVLIGGRKVGDGRFYERMVREADALYARHLAAIDG